MFEVVIGDFENSRICTAFRVSGYDEISENSESYWISRVLGDYGCNMKIHKKTDEGRALKRMISDKKDEEYIFKYLTDVYFQNINRHELYSLFAYVKRMSFYNGQRSKIDEFLKVLEVDNG